MDGPVNKRDLSTGENGEFATEPALRRLTMRPPTAPQGDLRREQPVAKHVECWGYARGFCAFRCCQQNGDLSSQLKKWLPGMDSNHDSEAPFAISNLLI